MNQLGQLIDRLCPDGVEYKPLWKVTVWDKKFNSVDNKKQEKIIRYTYLLASDLKKMAVKNGNVKLLSTGADYGYTTEEIAGKDISDGEIVAIPWGGIAYIQYYKGKFLTSDNRIATSVDKNVLDNKFLYYFMLNRVDEIQSYYRGSGIKHPDMAKILEMRIPLPPPPVQREIVRILDNFTELTAELTARKKQYEYYRDLLLLLNNDTNLGERKNSEIEWTKLNVIAKYSDSKIEAINVDKKSYVGVDNLLPNRAGKTISNYVPVEGRLSYFKSGDILIGNIRPYLKKIWFATHQGGTNGDVLVIQVRDSEKVLPRYLFHILSTDNFFFYNVQNSRGAKMPRGNKSSIMDYSIAVPKTTEVQQQIVNILDRFDALCNDITIGLPAEIEARQKQYEYYRDKLLSFKPTNKKSSKD